MKNLILIFSFVLAFVTASAQETEKDSTELTIRTWKLTEDFTQTSTINLDTVLTGFQVYNQMYNKNIYPAYLGNLGTAGISNSYFMRKNSELFFLQYYIPYLNQPEDQIYFNTKKPYSQIYYTTGGGRDKQEQTIGIIFTQNITPNVNVGLKVDVEVSEGQYPYQRASDNSLVFFTSYNGKRYSIYGQATMNNITLEDNGGIIDDNLLGVNNTEDIPTRLDGFNNAATKMRNRNIHIMQQFSLGRFKSAKIADTTVSSVAKAPNHEVKDWARLIHVFQYRKNHKSYRDDDPLTGFYRNVYIDSLSTYDSVYYRSIYNALSIDFQSNPERKFQFGANVGIENELNKYSYDLPPVITNINTDPIAVHNFPGGNLSLYRNDTSYNSRSNSNISNTAIRGRIFNNVGSSFGWDAGARFFLFGYKAGNMQLRGKIYKTFNTKKGVSIISANAKFRNERPNFWFNNFSSNNFAWENDLKFENETRVWASYEDPNRNFVLSANMSILGNYVYFDTLALPAQREAAFTVFSLNASKDFSLWKFKFRNSLNLQQSGNQEVLPLPLLSFRNSTYFEHVFLFAWTEGRLELQVGFDFYYHTAYNAYAYMPSSGRFYLQDEKKVGNYPFFDAFINFKVKRTRFFVKYEHVNSGWTGNKYFTILHNPMSRRVFKFGLSWSFYD
ncbi:MAG: putative porin [Bacteroidales bacterium]|nr:putative porin [Bacteroidales bacterium]